MIKYYIIWNIDCKYLRKYYGIDIIDFVFFYYERDDFCEIIESRIVYNLYVIEMVKIKFVVELVKVGFVILVVFEIGMFVVCFKCYYYYYIILDIDYIKQLERDYLFCLGKDCLFFVEEMGILVIMNFNKKYGREIYYKLFIIMKLIMMRK